MALSIKESQYNNILDFNFYSDYLMKRFLRILPAYYTAILFWNILLHLGITKKNHGIIDNITHLLFIHNLDPSTIFSISGVFWSIAIEMQFYIIFPLVLFFLLRFPLYTLLAGISFTLFGSIYSEVLLPQDFYKQFYWVIRTSLLNYLILFMCGIIGFLYKEKIISLLKKKIVLVVYLFLTFNYLFLHSPIISNPVINNVMGGLLLGFSMVMISNLKINSNNIFVGTLAKIGVFSFSIYLYNYIFLIYPRPVETGIYGWILYFILTCSFGILMYYLIEKPSEKLRYKFLRKKKESSKSDSIRLEKAV